MRLICFLLYWRYSVYMHTDKPGYLWCLVFTARAAAIFKSEGNETTGAYSRLSAVNANISMQMWLIYLVLGNGRRELQWILNTCTPLAGTRPSPPPYKAKESKGWRFEAATGRKISSSWSLTPYIAYIIVVKLYTGIRAQLLKWGCYVHVHKQKNVKLKTDYNWYTLMTITRRRRRKRIWVYIKYNLNVI